MKKDLLNENRHRVYFAFLSLIVLILLCSSVYGVVYVVTRQNDKTISLVLDGLSYTEDAAVDELSQLAELSEKKFLSTSTCGQLYRAMAEISYMTGDDMLYNQYVAFALFYLEQAGDTDSVIYITNKYIGRLYANGCYQSALDVLENLAEKNNISKLSLEMQASYYLSCADVTQMVKGDSTHYLTLAQSAIHLMPESGNRSLNQAKLDLLTARSDIQKDDFEQANLIMINYSEEDDFGLGANQVYVVCDYQLPFYEISAKLALNRGDFTTAYSYVDRYIEICSDYQFRTMKLQLLQYVVANVDVDTTQDAEKYFYMEKIVSQENLLELTNEYGQYLLSNIQQITEDLDADEHHEKQNIRHLLLGVILLYVAILLYCIGAIFMDYVNKDGLTHLNNRKKYERARDLCEKKKVPHCLLVIDIDNFKKINDTFGHETGDVVLRSIAAILQRYTGRGISSYRYGGEELCMLFLKIPEKRSREIAEEIRIAIENTVSTDSMHVTISGGIGVSEHGEDVFQIADRHLYDAKENGKNQIR